MLLKGTLAAAGFGATVVLSAAAIVGTPAIGEIVDAATTDTAQATLSLAPISLGNPTAAARLQTFRYGEPQYTVESGNIEGAIYHQTVRARRGDTLAGILVRAGVPGSEVQAAITALSNHYDPRRIRAGQEIILAFAPNPVETAITDAGPGYFKGLIVEPDFGHEVRVSRHEDSGFTAEKVKKTLARTMARAEGRIELSLYLAGKKAGLPDTTLAELIRAYSWDVDFQRDIRRGDGFQVMYERVSNDDGRVVRASKITFASLTLSGKPHPIYRFTTADGHTNYYDNKGHSARKALMRTPIDGARLSSGYGKRKHPILGYTKMHRGVDFAASRGTPIYAAGNGLVTYAGRKGAYGNYIRIRHNSEYSTAYAHMKGFKRGVRRGTRVNQGQVIGYVGTTGRSTGPHLHYEILRAGRQTNPMRVKMPSGRKLKGKELKKFQTARDEIDAQFRALATSSLVAQASE
jgi:murein DD-endopeptidase MepM/ murein hydrolase activator NlpD